MRVTEERADGVKTWVSFIGKGGPRFYLGYNAEAADPSYAFMIVQVSRYQAMDDVMARLRAFCRENLAGFKAPKHVVFGELPKTSTGKIQKFVLRETARSL